MAGKDRQRPHYKHERRVGYRPRRSGASPTVAQPEGPLAHELDTIALMHPEVMDVIDEATTILWEKKLGLVTRLTPEKIVSNFIHYLHDETDWRKLSRDAWLDWKTMLNVVRDIAIADPRYYGIADPVTEQYCSKCRKVKKLNEFPPGRIRCYECGDWRDDAKV